MATTTAKLKHDIDRGRAGDKVAVIDPAAVPLGTDDEAAGTPPTPRLAEQAHQDEIGARPVSSERNDSDHALAIYIGIIGVIVTTFGIAIWLTV